MARKSISEAEIREALLREAGKAFLRDGIMGAELKEIARNAGLSRSTLYRYAISRNRLAFLVAEQQLRQLVERAGLTDPPAAATGWERLRLYCEHIVAGMEERPDVLRMMAEFDTLFAGPYPDIPEARNYAASMQRLRSAMLRMVLDGLEDGSIAGIPDPDLFTAAVGNTIYGLASRFFLRDVHVAEEHGHTSHEIISEVLRLMLDHVKAPEKG